MKAKILTAVAAIALAGGAAPALAQDTGTTGDPYAAAPAQEEDNDFPWGLLGLLGLAGLMGRKKDNDTRRTNTTTGTGTNNRM